MCMCNNGTNVWSLSELFETSPLQPENIQYPSLAVLPRCHNQKPHGVLTHFVRDRIASHNAPRATPFIVRGRFNYGATLRAKLEMRGIVILVLTREILRDECRCGIG